MQDVTNVRLSTQEPWTVAHNSVMFDAEISMAARLLWLAYKSHAWSGNCVFPSRKRLSEMVGCSLRTLDRANDELESLGLIQRSNRFSEDGAQRTNEVVVCTPADFAPSVKNDTGGSKFDAPPVSNLAHINRRNEIDSNLQRKTILEGLPRPDNDQDEHEYTPDRKALYRAFSTARHIVGERFPLSVLDKFRAELDYLIEARRTPAEVAAATRNALQRWSSPAMVTFRSVVGHFDALLEEQAKQAEPTKAQKIATAEANGLKRARMNALRGDQASFLVLSDEDQRKIISHVEWDIRLRLLDGIDWVDNAQDGVIHALSFSPDA